jgi:hypothetical protein
MSNHATSQGASLNTAQETAASEWRYLVVGSLDDTEALPPKGEFFCRDRASWMPEISSEFNVRAQTYQ